ncbi:MAG: CBS domain-containing protein [Lysobacterales bacterium]|jgi:CBS domain-containing protein
MTDLYKLLDKMVLDSRSMPERSTIGNLPHHITSAKQRPVSEIMIKDIKTILPETCLKDIIDDVVDHKIHTFPVIKDGVLLGIIGRHDVLNAVFRYG